MTGWVDPDLVEDIDKDWDPEAPDGVEAHWAAYPGLRDAVVKALRPLGAIGPYDADAFLGGLMETEFVIVKREQT